MVNSFDYISDLHVDLSDKEIFDDVDSFAETKKSDILVINGDCSNNSFMTIEIIKQFAEFYKHIVFTDGNHEHYNSVLLKQNERILFNFAQNSDNIHYLNGNTVTIGNTAFIGANGWYDFCGSNGLYTPDYERAIWNMSSNDSSFIDFGNENPELLAVDQSIEIEENIWKSSNNDKIKNIVVMTHTVPIREGVVGEDHPWFKYNGSFFCKALNDIASNVGMSKFDKLRYWMFGHTHLPSKTRKENVDFICHPRGYPGEPNYRNYKQLTLEL